MEEASILTLKANHLKEIPDCLFQLPATYARFERGYSIWYARFERQGLLIITTKMKSHKLCMKYNKWKNKTL